MKSILAVATAFALGVLPATVLGHTSLVSSTPRAGQDLPSAPTVITLTFDGELDPESAFAVHGHDGSEVGAGGIDLEVADRNVLTGSVDIAEPGMYTVEWSVRGADGHEVTGTFSFGYATDEQVPSTATRPIDPGNRLLLFGIGLIGLAAVSAVRRGAVG